MQALGYDGNSYAPSLSQRDCWGIAYIVGQLSRHRDNFMANYISGFSRLNVKRRLSQVYLESKRRRDSESRYLPSLRRWLIQNALLIMSL
jgi:hypothetical protein